MGVVLAVGPIVGQLFGAGGCTKPASSCTRRCGWRSGCRCSAALLLVFPQPFLALAQRRAGGRRQGARLPAGLAFALPAALLFTAYRGFNIAVSRPKAVMVLQLGGLALKVPLSTLLVFGCRRSAAGARRHRLRHRDRDRRCGRRCSPPWVGAAARPVLRAASRSGRGLAPAAPREPGGAAAAGRADGAGDPDRGDRLHLHGVLHLAARRHAGGRAPDRGQHGVADVHAAAGARQRHRARWWRSASAPATCADARRLGWHGLRARHRSSPPARRAVYCCASAIVGLYTARRGDRRRGAAAAGLGRRCSTSSTRRRRSPRSCCAPAASRPCRWWSTCSRSGGLGLGGGYAAGVRRRGGVTPPAWLHGAHAASGSRRTAGLPTRRHRAHRRAAVAARQRTRALRQLAHRRERHADRRQR